MKEEFASRLRRLREAKGLTQESLAAAAGLTGGGIYSYESSRRAPNIVAAVRLAKALDVTTAELLGEDHELVVAARVAVDGLPPLDPEDREALVGLLRPVGA